MKKLDCTQFFPKVEISTLAVDYPLINWLSKESNYLLMHINFVEI